MNSATESANSEVTAWLAGGTSPAVLPPRLFGGDDTLEALEVGGDDIDRLHALALASALAAGEVADTPAAPDAIRGAPWELQALYFAACTHAPARFGRWQVAHDREIEELTDDQALEEASEWWGTLHTRGWEIARHDADGSVLVARWNPGDPATTLLRLDHELERKAPSWWAEVLGALVGIDSPRDRKLQKKVAADASPPHRRAHELVAYFSGARRAADLAHA